ncbi:MAG: phosphoribosyltransferase [Spirosomaceae bacterium]|jgi:pyrimidine operon attenuation protein/uracil phosphoribosyltransferase|nr:phosphoribosyltransferase [Spirosomataceae bacterium]
MSNKKILSADQTLQKIRRIAFEIYERNFDCEGVVLAGIVGEGYELAKQLHVHLAEIAQWNVALMKIDLDKTNPHSQPIEFDVKKENLAGQVVVVIDDVLNTGRTLAYSLSPFLGASVKRVQVAVMVNRAHHSYPISADYVGYALSTTLNEHVTVKLTGDEVGVYLD